MTSAAKKNSGDDNEMFADELAPGTSLLNGSYVIERFLNSGGFGITYLAKDSLDRSVVIKECFPGSFCRRSNTIVGARSRAHQAEFKSIVKLFVQEARSLSKLKHPNIVGVHQVFEDNDTAYMALDYVEGSDLLDIMDDGKSNLGPKEIQPILTKLLGAVAFIHDQGVLHRDISPDNILITDTDNPVLIDFGAAREEATKASRVLSALRVVKDGYSPQEFYIQGSDQSPSSDLYALGASFYHLIDGETPPNSQNRLAAIAAGENDPYSPLSGRIEGYEAGFLEAIDKALNVFPKDRVQSANEWLAMIDNATVAAPAQEGSVVSLPTKSATPEDSGSEVEDTPKAVAKAENSKTTLLLGSAAAVAIIAAVGAWQLTGSDDTDVDLDAQAPQIEAPAQDVATSDTDVETTEQGAAAVEPEAEGQEVVETETQDQDVVVAEEAEEDVTTTETQEADASESDVAATEAEQEFDQTPPTVISSIARPQARPQLDEIGEVASTVDSDVAINKAPELPEVSTNEVLAEIDTTPAVRTEAPFFEENPAVVELAPVMSAWKVDVPVSDAGLTGTTVDQDTANAIDWIEEGQTITEVNGLRIRSLDQIGKAIESTTDFGDGEAVEAVISYRDGENGPSLEKTVTLDVIHEIALLNGTSFQTQQSNDVWVTTVLSTREENPSGLLAGDVVLSYIPTGVAIDGPNSIRDVIASEIEAGKNSFNFAVKRDGSTWLASMAYDAEISN